LGGHGSGFLGAEKRVFAVPNGPSSLLFPFSSPCLFLFFVCDEGGMIWGAPTWTPPSGSANNTLGGRMKRETPPPAKRGSIQTRGCPPSRNVHFPPAPGGDMGLPEQAGGENPVHQWPGGPRGSGGRGFSKNRVKKKRQPKNWVFLWWGEKKKMKVKKRVTAAQMEPGQGRLVGAGGPVLYNPPTEYTKGCTPGGGPWGACGGALCPGVGRDLTGLGGGGGGGGIELGWARKRGGYYLRLLGRGWGPGRVHLRSLKRGGGGGGGGVEGHGGAKGAIVGGGWGLLSVYRGLRASVPGGGFFQTSGSGVFFLCLFSNKISSVGGGGGGGGGGGVGGGGGPDSGFGLRWGPQHPNPNRARNFSLAGRAVGEKGPGGGLGS